MSVRLFRWVVGVFCTVWLIMNLVSPIAAYAYFHNDYMHLSSACADAMDESWFIEQQGALALDKSAKIHLLSCHEYDKTRKIMLAMGLSENILAWLGLKALEINQHSAEDFVEQHRFRER